MKYAIVESGGKQYKAVEGGVIEVDRLPVESGAYVDLERVLLMTEGEDVAVGAPTVAGIVVRTRVLDHFKAPKVVIFNYRPKKRYRVKTGHRQSYTRLQIEHIGKAGEPVEEAPKAVKVEAAPEAAKPAEKTPKTVKVKAAPKAAKPAGKTPKAAKPAKSETAPKAAKPRKSAEK